MDVVDGHAQQIGDLLVLDPLGQHAPGLFPAEPPADLVEEGHALAQHVDDQGPLLGGQDLTPGVALLDQGLDLAGSAAQLPGPLLVGVEHLDEGPQGLEGGILFGHGPRLRVGDCAPVQQRSPGPVTRERTHMGESLGLPHELRVDVTALNGTGVITVAGDIDITSCRKLREELVRLMDDGVTTVVLDLSSMEFVDSTGLDVLVGAQKRLRQRGGELVLRSPRPAAQKVLEITRLDTVFTIENGSRSR